MVKGGLAYQTGLELEVQIYLGYCYRIKVVLQLLNTPN